MTAPVRHLLKQGPMLRALGRVALQALLPRSRHAARPKAVEQTLPPPSPRLVADFVRAIGGEPESWQGVVPPHLFPHWGLPLVVQALDGLPYPLHRILNAGCRLEMRRPLPLGEPLHARVELVTLDDDGRRVRLCGVVTTGTPSAPEALEATVEAYLPLAPRPKQAHREKAVVPGAARHVAQFELGPRAGLDFALLTGDFNPLHWVGPYARALGFRGPLAHGYSLLARTVESLVARELTGDPAKLLAVEVRFAAPVALPASLGLFVAGDGELWVGEQPAATACVTGRWERR